MSEDADERGYEVEALQSIFEDEFSWIEEPMEFEVSLKPVVEEGVEVHVEASLRVKYVENYPSESIPEYDVRTVKGLSSPLLEEMKELAIKCSTEELGGPVVYNACEALKEWLTEHNEPGQDDTSMYSVMMRKEAAKEAIEKEKLKVIGGTNSSDSKEAQDAAKEKARLRARAEGDAVTPESFAAWKEDFEREMKDEILRAHAAGEDLSTYDSYAMTLVFGQKNKDKLTGKQLFLQKRAEAVNDDEGDDDLDETVFKAAAGGSASYEDEDDEDDDDDSDYEPSDEEA